MTLPTHTYRLTYEVPDERDDADEGDMHVCSVRYYVTERAMRSKVAQVRRHGGNVLTLHSAPLQWEPIDVGSFD